MVYDSIIPQQGSDKVNNLLHRLVGLLVDKGSPLVIDVLKRKQNIY